MFDPRPLCCSSLTTAVGGTTDTNFVDSAHPTVARIKDSQARASSQAGQTICYFCRQPGHMRRDCPRRQRSHGTKTEHSD